MKTVKTKKKTSKKVTDKLNLSVVIKSCHEESEDQYCPHYGRSDIACKGCEYWF